MPSTDIQTGETQNPVFKLEPAEARCRYFADGFATPEECRSLIEFTDEHSLQGDGYGGNPHPHTPNETFAGYSFDGMKGDSRLAGHKLALQLFLRAREQIKAHYGLNYLWLEYGHLVVRDALSVPKVDEALSHQWHYDNQHDTIRHRTHTAILYLNDDFDGGLTRFKDTDVMPYREVQPTPGRLIAFSVPENAHSVSQLKQGRRYVLNMWFSTHWTRWRKHRKIFKPL